MPAAFSVRDVLTFLACAKELTAMPYIDEKRFRHDAMRLSGFDYSTPGFYFVTHTTQHRAQLFDSPEVAVMLPDAWLNLRARYPSIQLDSFVVMPNHVHGVLAITGTIEGVTLGKIMGEYRSSTTARYSRGVKENG